MKEEQTTPRPRWQQILDPILLLSWRAFLGALLILGLAAALTWLLQDRPGVLQTIIVVIGGALIPLYLLAALAYTIIRTQPPRRYLRLNRYTLLLIPAFFAGVVLHNLLYALFYPYYTRVSGGGGGDEPIVFIATTLGLPIYALLILLNTIVHTLRHT